MCMCGAYQKSTVKNFVCYLQYLCTGNWAAVLQLLFYRAVLPLLLPNCIFLFFPPIRARATVKDKQAEQSGFMSNTVIDLRLILLLKHS